MYKSKLSKVIVALLRRIAGVTRSGANRLMRAMLRSLMAMGRRANLPVAGFVLPTVTMVLLVVILLTVAITLRSFDRANTARNVRVNQQVLAAATPALDRAKAKIQYILGPGKPTSDTPSDEVLYQTMSSYNATTDLYTFGDEQRLVLKADLSGNTTATPDDPKGSIFNPNGEEKETLNTAWRYPVDTNNDGKFDTFTLYGIYFRTPKTTRIRKPLDARTPPMRAGKSDPACTQGEGTVANLVGSSGWERIDGRFQKSFFVYTVNVPITNTDITASALPANNYEAFKGTSSISALEYQQDPTLIPLTNNAVVYEDDLDISPGPPLNINGRIVTNSNLLVSALGGARDIKLFQVSSKDSCFYDAENSKIIVAGNVVNGWSGASTPNPVEVHLFKTTIDPQPNVGAPAIDSTNQSVAENSLQVLYNNQAYSERLNAVVGGQMDAATTTDPFSVQQAQDPPKSQTRVQALEDYFKDRLRKVPFAEVLPGTPNGGINPAIPKTSYIQGSGKSLRPIDAWSLPTPETAGVASLAGPTNLTIRPTQLASRESVPSGKSEENLGERVLVGNNLPAQRWDGNEFIDKEQFVDGATQWTGGGLRTRTPQVTKIGDVGATDRGNGTGEVPDVATAPNPPYRDGFWERTAAEISKTPLDSVGGLRVITSAGVYDRTNSFLPPPKWIDTTAGAGAGTLKFGPASALVAGNASTTYDDPATARVEQYPVVWPDSMPMSPLGPGSKVYDNTLGGADNWTTWVPAATGGASPEVVVTATDYSDLPTTQTNPLFSFVVEQAATARKFAKGDLRMRATAVYHYGNGPTGSYDPVVLAAAPAGTQPQQTALACVSSYYDPSNASTARNLSGLVGLNTDASGEGADARTLLVDNTIPTVGRGTRQAIIGSNNGITYGPPTLRLNPPQSNPDPTTGLLSGGDAILEAQANLVFPDGRFANGPLRTALQVPDTQRTLAQKSAIDSTNCALQILDGSINRDPVIPNGAIQEVTFLNGREIKAVDRDDPATIVNEAFTLSSPLGTSAPAAQLTGNYNQPLEEREPLEIRATQLNLNLLRRTPTPFKAGEFLLPNSGIIYASRDDALPDRSNRFDPTIPGAASASKRASPSDFQLDPTRKPNGIVLIRGQQLFRGGATPTATSDLNVLVREKGLTLVSNLPVYIKGDFNPHGNIPPVAAGAPPVGFTEVEEFTDLVNGTWSNFYGRTKNQLDTNFACRASDPRLPKCTVGDFWRPANVLADAVTLLSQNYRFGFRNEGDFDLRNNAGAAAVLPRRQQGFFNNNFATNGLSSGAFSSNGNLVGTLGAVATALTDSTYLSANPPLPSSYFNNFVTPVQRRGKFPEYVMETCTKLPLSECTDADWYVNPLATIPLSASALPGGTTYTSPPTNPAAAATATFQAGSTVDPPVAALQRFPRRVAFQRDPTSTPPNQLLNLSAPLPFGISGGNGGNIQAGVAAFRPSGGENALWFAANSGGNVAYDDTNPPYLVNTNSQSAGRTDGSQVPLPKVNQSSTVFTSLPAVTVPTSGAASTYSYDGSQPLLMPVPQILNVGAAVAGNAIGSGSGAQSTGWIPQAVDTTFNLIIAAGDTPSRALDPANGDFNGGLQNLPRFLEIWSIGNSLVIPNNIKGTFIQQNRSAFSTAPYLPILPDGFPAPNTDRLASLFDSSPIPPAVKLNLIKYNIQGTRIPYFTPPKRNWGFDVGLLSQPPDLFTQKFTTPSTETRPAEYFREVGRDDEWVKTLMCGVLDDGTTPATSSRPNKDCFPPA